VTQIKQTAVSELARHGGAFARCASLRRPSRD